MGVSKLSSSSERHNRKTFWLFFLLGLVVAAFPQTFAFGAYNEQFLSWFAYGRPFSFVYVFAGYYLPWIILVVLVMFDAKDKHWPRTLGAVAGYFFTMFALIGAVVILQGLVHAWKK